MTTSLDKRRVLVADDESMVREMYFQVLALDFPDCRVDLAVNGEEAVAAFREGHHAVLVMDIYMPVLDGEMAFHAIEKLCEDEDMEEPAVIFCTGYDPPELIRRIVDENSRHCLMRKPINTSDLVEALKERLEV